MDNAFLVDNQDFVVFGRQHAATLLAAAMICLALIIWAKKYATQAQQHLMAKAIGLFTSCIVIVWTGIRIALGKFDPTGDLPLALCNMMAVSIPILMFTRNYRLYEVFYFWIFTGTIQAIITPDLKLGFPHHTYFKYWTVHLGLVICILYITLVFNMRPTWRGMFRAFAGLQLYVVIAFFANKWLGSNYGYLNHKPNVASLLDYFGDWPWYILVSELLAIPFFLLSYLPIYLSRKKIAQ